MKLNFDSNKALIRGMRLATGGPKIFQERMKMLHEWNPIQDSWEEAGNALRTSMGMHTSTVTYSDPDEQ